MDPPGPHTSRGVAREVMEKTLGRWTPGHSRRNPQIQVHLISSISRALIPVSRSAVYRGGSWIRRMGKRVGSWVGAGIKLFGGVAVVVMSTVPAHLWANPEGEVVVGGAANFNRPDAATLIVNQQTDRAVINWNNFSIANGELTRFVQPSSTSAALNRVVTANPSQIYGTLQANGQIYLINPGGVMVGPGGMVDVAGFVASTHDIANEEFMRGGNLNFHGNSEASILNQGRVEAREGDVFLVAREVKNEGQLMAKDGTVGMVSGTEVSLQAVGQGNFKIRLLAAENESTTAGGGRREAGAEAEIVNEGVIQAANAVLEAKGSYLPMAIKNTGLIEATGVRENGDGTVSLTGGEGDVLNTGVVAALQRSLDGRKETGGSILMAGKNVTSDPGSMITAAGRDGGGTVKLRSSYTTELRGEISVVGGGESVKGGQVQLLGERVGLFDQAKVDASGGAGGGTVLVGGDFLGKNPEVPNAKAVVMAPTAKITADATVRGEGGKAVLWSDIYTAFFGEISALGGATGGNGGFVETSSADNLQAFGKVDASARSGKSGLWLLDPRNVAVVDTVTTGGSFTGGNPSVFTPTADSAQILNTEINSALNRGTSVTITTGSTGTQDGDILVSAGISKTLDNDTTLRLEAARNITINADIISTSNKLFMDFIADADANNNGTFILGAGADLLSNGGDITVTAADVQLQLTGTMNTLQTLQVPVTVVAGGTYAAGTVPTVTIAAPAGVAGGVAATATALMGLNNDVGVGFGGAGYTSAPKVVIGRGAGDTTGGGATAVATINGAGLVTGITITNPGSGYTATPTFTFVGGGGAGATAVAGTTQVVNLLFDGSGSPVSVPSYGVGYAPGISLTTGAGQVAFSGGGGAQATLGPIGNIAGNVLLKPSVAGRTIGVGGDPASNFNVDNIEIGQITLNGSILNGTLTIGDRTAGAITLGAGGAAAAGARNLALVTGGSITDTGAAGVTTTGLLTLSAAGSVGGLTAGNTLDISGPRVSIITEGDLINLTSAAILTQLHVKTDGSVTGGVGPNQTQTIVAPGLTYTIQEFISDDASFGTTGVAALSVLNDSLDFSYENTTGGMVFRTYVNAIAVGAPGVGYTSAPTVTISRGVGDVTGTGATAVATINGAGQVNGIRITNPGVGYTVNPTITISGGGGAGATATATFVAATPATPFRNVRPAADGVPNNFRPLAIRAPNGTIVSTAAPINSGGGNITLTSRDLVLGAGIGTADTFYNTAPVLNTFQAVGGTFGTRGVGVGTAGQISGIGGVLTLEATSPDRGGQVVTISTTGGRSNAYNLSRNETMLLEAPAIRIGGADADDFILDAIFPRTTRALTYNRGAAGALVGITYLPRYFENPFFDAVSDFGPDNDVSGVPHVSGGTVSFISGKGEIRNVPDADINVFGLSMTAIDGAFFDGRGGGNDYAGRNVTADARGSLVDTINGRTGRTLQNETIGSGGDFNFFIGQSIAVVDGRILVGATGAATPSRLTGTASQAATATATQTGGQVTSLTPNNAGTIYQAAPVVTLYGGGIQEASARALVNSSGVLEGVVPQVMGTGYTRVPDIVITGGGKSDSLTASGFINTAGQLSVFDVVAGGPNPTYSSAPTIQIFGNGTGAVARPILSNGTSGTLLGVQIVDPGSGYTSVAAVVLSGGGVTNPQNQAQVVLAPGYNFTTRGGQLTPIYVAPTTGYTSEPTVTISGGGIRQAQATALVDLNPSSSTRGQVVGYQITDPGQGYRSAPSVLVGQGQAFGNFGEYGVSTEQVDRNRASGSINLDTVGTLNNVVGQLSLNAPVRTGDALGVGGTGALSGSILLNVGSFLTANSDNGSDGVLITGDASINGSLLTSDTASSGSITITAYDMQNNGSSRLSVLSGSTGLPIQIGTAQGGGVNSPGTLQARVTDRVAEFFGAGDLKIYAPAPGEIDTAAGAPIDPNHPARPPRASNDLFVSGLQTDVEATDNNGVTRPNESLVTVEVGGFKGQLTLLQYAPSSATATLGVTPSNQPSGQVTLISPVPGGPLFSATPTVVVTGGGIVKAEALASVSGGQVTGISVTGAGSGYGDAPTVTITGGGGSGATATATVKNGVVTGITMTNLGFGYTSIPTVVLGPPSGTAATATATAANYNVGGNTALLGISSITLTQGGTGYTAAPLVTITDAGGLGFGATATTTINSAGQVTSINITNPGFLYVNPQVTLSNPAGIAQATANLTDGRVTSYTITDAGAGYGSAPSVYLQTRADPYNLDIDKVMLAADRFSILATAPTSILVTAESVVLAPFTNQQPVNLGSDLSGSTSLVSADLQRFQVNNLVIGRRQSTQPTVGAGKITISQAISASSLRIANGVVLAGTREIVTDPNQPTAGLAFENVVLDAGGTVALTGTGSRIHYLSGVIRDSGLAENATFTLASNLSTSGTSTFPLTIGDVFADVAYGTGQRFYQGLTTQNGDVRIFANQLQQTRIVGFIDTTGGGLYPATTSQVTLAPLTAGVGINLYATTPTSSSVLGLRLGNPEAPGLEQVSAKGLVIGSGSLRDIQITNGGFGYQAPPTVTISGGGGSGATAQGILSETGYVVNGVTYFRMTGIRITNPGSGYTSAPTVTIAPPTAAAFTSTGATAAATIGAAGAITLNTNLEFNYLQYPQAPFQVSLISGSTGSITAGTSQTAGGGTSRIRVGALTITDGGTVSLTGANDVDELAATITGSGSFSFTDTDAIRLGAISVANALTITAGTVVPGAITQTTDGITVGGAASFTSSTSTGGQAITLTTASNNFGGAVSLANAGAFNVAITDVNALTLGTLTIPGGNLTATSTGALNLGAGVVGGNLTANSNGGAISQTGALTINGISTITAGAAAITLANASNNFGGTVTLSNSGPANGITLSDGIGNLTIGNVTSQGAVAITATGAGGILLFNGTYDGLLPGNGLLSGSLTATAASSVGSVNLRINSSMTSLSAATLQTDGIFTLSAGANLGNTPTFPATTTTTSISVLADSLVPDPGIPAGLLGFLTAQSITLQPFTSTLSLGLNNAAAGFNVPASLLTGGGQRIFAKDNLILGSSSGTGGITIGNDGVVNLLSQSYGLTLRGLSGGVTFANTLFLPNNTTFDLSVGSSDVNAGGIPGTGIAVSIGGTGTISFGSAGNVNSFTGSAANLGASNVTGNLNYISDVNLNVGQMSVGGTSTFLLPTGGSFTAVNPANAFTGSVSLIGAGGLPVGDVTINNSKALTLGNNLSMNGSFSSTVANGGLSLGTTSVGANFTATAVGISGGPLTVNGTTTLAGGTGNITLTGANSFGGSVTVGSSANTSLFIAGTQLDNLGAVQATGNFALTTNAGLLTLPTVAAADNQLSSNQIQNFSVGSLSLTAPSILVNSAFNFPNIQTLTLNSTTGDITVSAALTAGNLSLSSGASITASGALTAGNLSLSSGTSARLSAGNRIGNLGTVRTSNGNFTFANVQGMNLAGSVSVAGTADLTVAGQFYNYSGQATPFAGTTGRAVVRSLSMMGGLPNQISALAGFTPSYNFTDPGTSRAMIYAVSPLTMFAPNGTVIAGVDLSGTQTGGAQLNTFFTGSDNLNWMIADFGKFNLPKVDPAQLQYMLYQQRVEPETRSLPQPVMRELTQELGRPPTIGEIQQREVARRQAVQMRSGAILERSSFDEDVAEPKQEAAAPSPVIDGGKPQAGGPSVAPSPLRGGALEGFEPQAKANSEIEKRKAETVVGGRLPEVGGQPSFAPSPASAGGASEGFGPQAKKQTDTRRDPSGPMLRSGPQKAVALRAEPVDATQIIQAERERAEVNVAPPVAASPR